MVLQRTNENNKKKEEWKWKNKGHMADNGMTNTNASLTICSLPVRKALSMDNKQGIRKIKSAQSMVQ